MRSERHSSLLRALFLQWLIGRVQFSADPLPPQSFGNLASGSTAEKWIEYDVSRARAGEDTGLDQRWREGGEVGFAIGLRGDSPHRPTIPRL